MAEHLFIEAVLAFKARGLGVVLAEKIVGVDRGVVDAEESPAELLLLRSYVLKLLTLHLIEMLNDVASDAEGFLVILAAVEKFMFTGLEHFAQ